MARMRKKRKTPKFNLGKTMAKVISFSVHFDSVVKRRIGGICRVLFTILWWTVTFVILILVASRILSEFGDNIGEFGDLVGFAVWLIFSAYTVRSFIVSVPEITGLVTINLLAGGELTPYGPGLHFKYPWEQVKDGNYINFRLVKGPRTEIYPAKDGPALVVKWFFQYRPRLELLGRYIAVSKDVIDTGLNDVGSSFLSLKIATMDAEKCKLKQKSIETALKKSFDRSIQDLESDGIGLGIPVPPKKKDSTLEYLYGIHIVEVGLNDVNYEQRYQKARATKAIAKTLKETAHELQMDKDGQRNNVGDKDSQNTALIINGQVTKNVQEVEGEGMQALGGLFLAGMRGGKDEKKGKDKKEKDEEGGDDQ